MFNNANKSHQVNMPSKLQPSFEDIDCEKCTKCMENAIKARRVRSHVISNKPNLNNYYYDVLNTVQRRKRNVVPNDVIKEKSISATIAKYTKNRKIFAIEIKAKNKKDLTDSCKVYTVKKSLPCESKVNLTSTAKRRITKRNKNTGGPIIVSTTKKVKAINLGLNELEADNFYVPENYMPSIENLY